MASEALQCSSFSQSPSAILLAKLRQAHEQLFREMEEMDRMTLGPAPDLGELAARRWHISQASLRRRKLSRQIIDFLSDRTEGCDPDRLSGLKSAHQRAMSKSAAHIYAWTMQAISKDWKGYCKASRQIRVEMKANILLERDAIYPMLERLAALER